MGPLPGYAALSGARPPHLKRRNGIYHFRMRVPEALKLRVGMGEVGRSLRTYSLTRARLLAALCVARLMEVFQMLKAPEFTKADAREMVRGVFDDLVGEVDDGILPTSNFPDLEILEQRCFAQSRVAALQTKIAQHEPDMQARLIADGALVLAGREPGSLPPGRRADLYDGVARALIEQQRLFILRLEDRLAPYMPVEALFASRMTGDTTSQALAAESQGKSVAVGATLSAAVQDYLAFGRGRWTAKTHKSRERMLGYLVEHLGTETILGKITSHDVREFRDAIRQLRKNHRRGGDRTFRGKQTDNGAARIASKTARLIFEPCKAFFSWSAEVEGLIEINPAKNVRIEPDKSAKAVAKRRSFRADELKLLFSSPVFTGCQSIRRRRSPGVKVYRDAWYWIPLLGYYTGARLGELVQIHIEDVQLTAPHPFLEMTDANSGGLGSGAQKHLKSPASVRRIPLHPDLIALGFAAFVEQRGKAARSKRLFDEVGFGSDGQASTRFSKWFARLLDSVGVTDEGVVFHSFRHNAEDALRNALQPQYVIDRIVGHSDGKVSSQYGIGVDLETAFSAVTLMKLPFDVRHHLISSGA